MGTTVEHPDLTPTPRSQMKPATLAVILSALLIDAAVETFVNGSPVRWWVGGIVAAYVALAVFVWRRRPSVWQRIGWPARASSSFFLLLALLTFTAWLPGGLSDGIRLLGQPTSRVLSLLTAAVIALAGASLVRLSWLPRWAKAVITLLTAYGLAAFLKGIISGTEFAALLRGESLWTRLPFWLQGAFVGAFIVVPAGLLLHVAHMIRSAAGVSRSWEVRQVIAMATSVAMVISGVTNSAYGGPQPSAAEIVQPVAKSYQELSEALAGPKPKAPLTPDQVADRLDKLFPMLEKAEREIPRDTFDLQAVIDKVGKDPEKLFAWVRDNTYFVSYRGLLRGDKGVLMDRLGNSLDRAMLLYAMLRNIGQPARLAHGNLTETQAKDVLKKARPFPTSMARFGSDPLAAATGDLTEGFASLLRQSPQSIQRRLAGLTIAQQGFSDALLRRATYETALINSWVQVPRGRTNRIDLSQQISSATDHWWVQWQRGTNWTDLDATLPDSHVGQALTIAQGNAAPDRLTELGEDLLHRITIEFVIEVSHGGRTAEVSVLRQELLPAALIGERIVLRVIPMHWAATMNVTPQNRYESIQAAALTETEWFPVLRVGDTNIGNYSFDDYGDLTDTTLPGFVQNVMVGRVLAHKEEEAVEGLGKSVGGMLGGPGGQQQPSGQKPPAPVGRAQITAAWVVYRLKSPGTTEQEIRRPVFDLLGSARTSRQSQVPLRESDAAALTQRSLALLTEIEILPVVCQLSVPFVGELAVSNMLANHSSLTALLRSRSVTSELVESLGGLRPLPGPLYALALTRSALASPDVYLDRPNVFSYVQSVLTNQNGVLAMRHGLDIVENAVAVRPGATDHFMARLTQGVLDTNSEAAVMGNWGEVENAAEALAASGGHGWIVLGHNDNEQTRRQMLNSLAMHWSVEQDFSSGDVILLQREGMRVRNDRFALYWRIDPNTGSALGYGRYGGGEASSEYMLMLKKISTADAVVLMAGLCGGTVSAGGLAGSKAVNFKTAPTWGPLAFCLVSACAVGGGLATVGGAFAGFLGILAGIFTNVWLGQ